MQGDFRAGAPRKPVLQIVGRLVRVQTRDYLPHTVVLISWRTNATRISSGRYVFAGRIYPLHALVPIPTAFITPPFCHRDYVRCRDAVAAVDDIDHLHLKSSRNGRPIKVSLNQHTAARARRSLLLCVC